MKTLTVSPKLKNLCVSGIVVGVVCFFIAFFFISPARAWHGYLMNYYFFMCLGLGGVFFAATQHLTNAGWSATVRRIPESFHSWLPWAVLLIIPVFIGGHYTFQWFDTARVNADPVLKMKTPYLNIPFFGARTAAFFVFWFLIGGALVKNSLKQDEVGGLELTKKNSVLSGLFMPLFVLLFSIISFDLVMSLDPHWFSTMFGVNCFANLFLSTIAACVIVVIHMKRAGYFGESVNVNHIQNLGLLLFAFVIFYAYITFCQYLLIWYANLPEETSYYLRRWEHGWMAYACAVMLFKFFVPFLLLLPREAKRNMTYLVRMAYLVFAACWLDMFWMVMPAYSQTPLVPILELGIGAGFLGAFVLVFTKFLSRHPIQPQKDPRVQEALHLHYQ